MIVEYVGAGMPIWQRKPICGAFTDDEGLAGALVHESEEGQWEASGSLINLSEERVSGALPILGLRHSIPLRTGDWMSAVTTNHPAMVEMTRPRKSA
jgi:hypothetical protein